MARRRFFAPEVVQTSNMDCGPASLKCLCQGFGIDVSYGRLREACQTGVDGTSLDTMETVAQQLGLAAGQIMVPLDHLFLGNSQTLPCIIVVKLAAGLTHFVVAWRKHGGVVQVMDPATGRRWPSCARFLQEVYVHTTTAPATDWLEYASSPEFQDALSQRMRAVGISHVEARKLREEAATGWRSLTALDAAVRMTDALIRSGGLVRGSAVVRVIRRFAEKPALIPARYWSARPNGDEDEVVMRGAVLVRVLGLAAVAPEGDLPLELAASLAERPPHPVRELLRLLHAGGHLAPSIVIMALALAAAGVMAEAVLFRGLFDLGRELGLAGQRMAAMAALIAFSAALLLFEVPTFAVVLRLARQLENRLRMAFLDKIPRLGDRYFQSRLTSDMAERSHTTQRLRHLPDVARQLLRSIFELLATTAGIIWLDPAAAPLAILAAGAALVPPFIFQPLLAERDLRLRSHAAALTRYYLDALLGLVPIRAHGAERALRRQHENLLEKWARAGFSFQRSVLGLEAGQLITIFGLVAWILLTRLGSAADVGRVLLLVYWALNIPTLGQDIGALARQLPYYRNLTLRLLEPLGAPEEPEAGMLDANTRSTAPALEFQNVTVQASGHLILQGVSLAIEAGEQIAIIGPSGAGKSSLVGLLLGWLRPSAGNVLVDGQPLDCESLRSRVAWVDPSVQLWNRSLFENLTYGQAGPTPAMEGVMDSAQLRNVLESLPDGLQTKLGEGGGLLSGGQGQRVRLARAMLKPGAGLVILDEPFRGLDRQRRRELLTRARELWKGATLLCITHDIDETRAFKRVLVVEQGRVIEDGDPTVLADTEGSRYAQLLNAETDVRTGLWSGETWRRVRIEAGKLTADEPAPAVTRERELMDTL